MTCNSTTSLSRNNLKHLKDPTQRNKTIGTSSLECHIPETGHLIQAQRLGTVTPASWPPRNRHQKIRQVLTSSVSFAAAEEQRTTRGTGTNECRGHRWHCAHLPTAAKQQTPQDHCCQGGWPLKLALNKAAGYIRPAQVLPHSHLLTHPVPF